MKTLEKQEGCAHKALHAACLTLLAMGIALLPRALWAANPTYDVGNLRWTYTTAGAITGVSAVSGGNVEGFISVPSSLNGVKITSLSKSAFDGKNLITQISIPEGVSSIGAYCFRGCKRLSRLTLPSTVRTIGNYAFYNCSELYDVGLNEGLTDIGSRAFVGCASLKSLKLPSTLLTIGGSAFEGVPIEVMEIPDSVTSIGSNIFQDCTQLGTVTVGRSVQGLTSYMFDGCTALSSVTLKNNGVLRSIGAYCFHNCKRLPRLTLPSTVRTIGNYAFYNCSELYDVGLNEGLTDIGSSAFVGCSSLRSLKLPSTLLTIGGSAFEGVPIEVMEIPDSVTSIGSNIFQNCTQLGTVTVGRSVQGLTIYMFDGCTALSSVTLREDGLLYSIGAYCFRNCKRLTRLTIPSTVRTIGNYAFYNCANLDYIYFKGDYPTSISNSAFNNVKNAMIVYRNASSTGFGSELLGHEVRVWQGEPTPTPATYTVTFNSNGGSGSMTAQTFTQGVSQSLKLNAFTKSGYTFDGWMTSANGNSIAYVDGESIIVSANMTLYAKWVQNASTSNLRFHSDNRAVSDGVWFREYFLNNENPVTLDQNPRVASTICRGGFVRPEEMGGWGIDCPPCLCLHANYTGNLSGYYSARYEIKVNDEVLIGEVGFYTNAPAYTIGGACPLWGIYNAPVGDYTATVKLTDPSGAYATKTKSFRLNDSEESVASALKSSSAYVNENSYRPLTEVISMGLISLGGDGTWLGTQGGDAISGYVPKGGSSRLSMTAKCPIYYEFYGELVSDSTTRDTFQWYKNGTKMSESVSWDSGILSSGDSIDWIYTRGNTDIGLCDRRWGKLGGLFVGRIITVRFDSSGGGDVASMRVVAGGNYRMLYDQYLDLELFGREDTERFGECGSFPESPTPPHMGDEFLGWYNAAGVLVTADSIIPADSTDHVLTARWRSSGAVSAYAITYKPGSYGTGSQQTATKTKDMALILKGAIFTRTGYTQTGWSTSDGGAKTYDLGASYMANAALTLYPFWTANGYTVSLDRQNGSGGTYVLTATYGRPMPSITVPSRSGYAFGGYYTGTNGGGVQYYTASGASAHNWDRTSSTTLYAKWTVATTPTSFTFGGDASWVKQRDGSWKSGKIGDNESTFASTTMIGPGTISFKWRTSSESNYDKLHFYVNGAEPVVAISGEMDSWASVTYNVTASGSVTLKWEYAKDYSAYSGSDCGWIKDVTWTPKEQPAQTYILRLHRNNSSRDGATAGRTYTIGKARALPKIRNELKWAPRKGYDFLGWARTANATEAQYTDGQSLKDLTKTAGATVHLYAVWKAHKYIVRLHRNNSKNDGATTGRAFDYDQVRFLPTMAELKWVRSGYMFLGWSQAQSSSTVKYADGLNVFNLSPNDGEELHIWGVWKKAEANAYLLRLHRNNSERDGATAGRQLKLNTNRKLPTVRELGWSRTDATFKGWATTAKNAAAGKVAYKDGATVKNLVKTAGDTAHIYAVWQ